MHSFENGEINLDQVAQEHARDTVVWAIERYDYLVRRKGSNIATESTRHTRNERYHRMRLRIRGFGKYIFPGNEVIGDLHPKAQYFAEGAISAYDSLRLHWVRLRQAYKNTLLDFAVSDALIADTWPRQDIAETHIYDTYLASYLANHPTVIEALTIDGEDKGHAFSRALGVAWLGFVATPIEICIITKDSPERAKYTILSDLDVLKERPE